MSFQSQVISASKWSALAHFSSQAISPLIFLILARLLTPEDFGVVAIAGLIINFSRIFWVAGLTKALIQRETDSEDAAYIVFWTNFGLSVIIYIGIFFTADLLAQMFHEPRAKAVIQIMGLQIILTSLIAVHEALFRRSLNFKPLFWVNLFTTVIPGCASIPLALSGFGYWALVGGSLVGTFFQVLALWKITKWRPAFRYNLVIAKQLFSFGLWATAEVLLVWICVNADAFIVGRYLDIRALGLYRTGSNFINLMLGMLLAPILPVAFSAFSRLQNEREYLYEVFIKVMKIVTLVAFPAGCGAFVLQDYLAATLFREAWAGVGAAIGWLGLAYALSWMTGINNEVYRAIGRPDISTKILVIATLVYVPSYLFAVRYGLGVFLVVKFGVVAFGVILHLYYMKTVLGVPLNLVWQQLKWILLATVCMGIGVSYIQQNFVSCQSSWGVLLLLVSVGIVIYGIALYKEWAFMRKVIGLALGGKKRSLFENIVRT